MLLVNDEQTVTSLKREGYIMTDREGLEGVEGRGRLGVLTVGDGLKRLLLQV